MKETIITGGRQVLVILISIIMITAVMPVTASTDKVAEDPVQSLNYVDLNNWKNHGDGTWAVETGGRTVRQTENGNPTFFLSPEYYIDTVITGTIKVDTDDDNDMIGFVMGYENSGESYGFVLFDWKQGMQTENNYSDAIAEEGYTLGHFSGELSQVEYSGGLGSYSKYFWYHEEEKDKFDRLGTDYGSNKGWKDLQEYQFKILYTSDRIKVVIDDEVIFDVYGSFNAGKIGFYNNSQLGVVYGNVQTASGTSGSASPVAQSDQYGMSMNSTLSVNSYDGLLFNDYDPNLDNYTIENVSTVSNGILNVETSGAFSYTPDTDFTGMDSFTYNLRDDEENTSETVTVEINVIEGSNQAPTDLALSNILVDPELANGDVLCTLSTSDPNDGDFHDYMLVENAGGRFAINGNQILINNRAIINAGNDYNLTVRSTDFQGLYLDKTFTIKIPYTVSFVDYDYSLIKSELVLADHATSAPAKPSRVGYTFTGWDPADHNNINSNLSITAQYTANTDTAYKVEHYQMNVDGSGYTLKKTDELTGTTDTIATAEGTSYTGFTENIKHADRLVDGTIAGDGSLVLKLYYDRDSYTVKFVTNGGSTVSDMKGIYYEALATLPEEPTKPGYTFVGWYSDSELETDWDFNADIMPPEDLTLYAKWTANRDTAYKVEHYQMNVDGSGYTLKKTDELTGTTDTTATAEGTSYTGFTENIKHADRLVDGTIAGDGSLVLKLYYHRDSYTIKFVTNGGSTVSDMKGIYYEALATLPEEPTKPGYTFVGWYSDSELETDWDFNADIMPPEDLTLYAKWTANRDTAYKVEHYLWDVGYR